MKNMLLRRRIMLGLASSPFSPEATAILKEDFPDEWNDIKAYGYIHPETITYINEDPYFVVSLGLIDGVYRFLIGDGTAYIRTSIVPQNGLTIDSVVNRKTNATGVVFYGIRADGNHKNWTWYELDHNASFNVNFVNPAISYTEILNNITTISHTFNGSIIINGVNVGSQPTGTIVSGDPRAPISIFGTYRSVAEVTDYIGTGIMIAFLDVKLNDNRVNKFISCKNPNGNDYGMLDIVNDVFYPNSASSGAFTIEYSGRPYLNITSTTKTYIINTYGESAWNTVKEFFTNPDNEYLVKYVNEDPDIVCSLVDIGYTRWLVGDGNSLIKTSYVFNDPDTIIYTKFKKTNNKTQWLFGSRNDDSIYPVQVAITSENKSRIGFGCDTLVTATDFSAGININNICNVVLKKNYCTINGIQQPIESYVNMPNVDGSYTALYILGLKRPTDTGDYFETLCFDGKIAYLKVEANNPINFVPFKRNNVNGMIDLLTNTFYPNGGTGAFTISIEQNS